MVLYILHFYLYTKDRFISGALPLHKLLFFFLARYAHIYIFALLSLLFFSFFFASCSHLCIYVFYPSFLFFTFHSVPLPFVRSPSPTPPNVIGRLSPPKSAFSHTFTKFIYITLYTVDSFQLDILLLEAEKSPETGPGGRKNWHQIFHS
jgi:hypothetical protein